MQGNASPVTAAERRKAKLAWLAEKPAIEGHVAPKAVVVLASQRSGSTLLCQSLESTRLFGKPREHMLAYTDKALAAGTLRDTREMLERGRIGPAFGIKMMITQIENAAALLAAPEEARAAIDDPETLYRLLFRRLPQMFGDVRYVLIERQDKFAQAYSMLRAKRLELFHVKSGESAAPSAKIDFAHKDVERRIRLGEMGYARLRAALAAESVTAHEVSYEAFVANPQQEFRAIIRHLGHDPDQVPMPQMPLEKVVKTEELEEARARFLARPVVAAKPRGAGKLKAGRKVKP